MRDDLDLDRLKSRLLARRAELSAHAGVRESAGETVELDQQRTGRLSRMDALQQQAMARATRQRASDELRRIDAALERMAAGEFGCCVRCGEDIAAGRLDADPSALLCLACAEREDPRR